MKNISLRKALAVPTALALALGGALLMAAPANAAGTLDVTAPEAGSTTTSRTVDVTGTAPANSQVRVYTAQGGTLLGSENLTGGSSSFSIEVAYADDAPTAESIYVDGLNGGSGFSNPTTVAFNIPAVAPSNALTLDAPAAGSTATSRTVTFTGTAPEGSLVTVTDAAGVAHRTAGSITGTTYSIPVTYAADAPVSQTVTVSSFAGGRGADNTVTRTFNLPAAAPVGDNTLTLDTPAAGTTTASRTVTFTGTAPATSIVTVTDAGGVAHRTDGSITGTTYSIEVTYAADAPVAQTVTVSSFAGGRGADNTVTRSFNLPVTAPQTVATPVITSPKNGAKLTGKTVTVTGTGTPGANIELGILTPAEYAELLASTQPAATQSQFKSNAKAQAAQAPVADDPADPIVVGANGSWTVTLAVAPGSYVAVADSFLLNADGTPVLDGNGDPVFSDLSAPVDFTLAAAAVTAPAGTGTTSATGTGTSDPGSLAFTGSNTAPVAGIAGILLALGGALTFIARRRRALLGR